MTDPAAGLSILHVIVRAGPTNSQYNEHCLPVLEDRDITVCSLFPADVTPPPRLTLFEGDGTVRGCVRALRRALAGGSYDVVHVHAPASGVLTLAVYLWTRRSRRDLVFTVHNSWRNFTPRNRMFLRLILALFPLVVVCGRAAFDSLPQRLRRRRHRKLVVVPNGVDTDRIGAAAGSVPAPADAGRPPGRTVVSVNRLIPLKDPATVLEAFARARGKHDRLVFVGEGPLRERLEASVRRFRLDRHVTFTGLVPRDEVYRTLKAADVFVTASGGEGLPVALLEAMGSGCPVVASDIPPHREIARVARGIPLVPVGDTAGFARALGRILTLDDEQRQALGRSLRRHAEEDFSVRTMNQNYGEVYMRAGDHRGRRATLRPAEGAEDPDRLPFSERLRQHVVLATVLTVVGGIGGYTFAQVQAPVFKGETTLMVGSPAGAGTDEETLQVSTSLAHVYADLARREPVLGPVAAQGYGDSWRDVQRDVQVETGDKNARLVQISAYADTARAAAALAAAVADQLTRVVAQGAGSSQSEFVQEQLGVLRDDISATTRELAEAERLAAEAAADDAGPAARVDTLRSTLLELQAGYAELQQLDRAGVGSLTRVDDAWATRSPLRPTPVGLALAGAAIGFALAAARVQLGGRRGRGGPVPAGRPARQAPRHEQRGEAVRAMRFETWAEPEPLGGPTPKSKRGNRS